MHNIRLYGKKNMRLLNNLNNYQVVKWHILYVLCQPKMNSGFFKSLSVNNLHSTNFYFIVRSHFSHRTGLVEREHCMTSLCSRIAMHCSSKITETLKYVIEVIMSTALQQNRTKFSCFLCFDFSYI